MNRGLGDNWLDRETAEAAMYQPATGSSEKHQQESSKIASYTASVTASSHTSDDEQDEETPLPSVVAEGTPLPPPPARQREARVQFNHRILQQRDRLLQKYKTKHGTTMQAIVDQMVDEYLARRGLLPKDND